MVDGRMTLFGIGGTEGMVGMAPGSVSKVGEGCGGAEVHGGTHGPANLSRMSFCMSLSSINHHSLMK